VRTQRFKYIRYPTRANMDELYDLARDPNEMNNLVGGPSVQAERAQLAADLERLLAATR
jgi:arylsulfatase A-like enzyme